VASGIDVPGPTLYQGALTLSRHWQNICRSNVWEHNSGVHPVWEPGLGVRATGISCVARSSELRAVRVTMGPKHTLQFTPLLPSGFAPIMTVLKLKNAVGVVLVATPSSSECYLRCEGLIGQCTHIPFPRLPILRAWQVYVLYVGAIHSTYWLFVSNWRLVWRGVLPRLAIVYSGYALLCCAMLCYAMLNLCYAMLPMLCYAICYRTMLCYALCYAMLCYACFMLCYVMLCVLLMGACSAG
jgi:hypothetical protein